MEQGVPPESQASGSQIHPLLRQRMLSRAATFSEGAQPIQPLNRRRSSILSEYSDTRQSFRSSTDSLLRPGSNDMDKLTSSDEPSFWHSAPLAFAILPAVGGLLFHNGGAIVTDITLLLFASMFLNWCVRAPWDWHAAAQQVQYIDDGDEADEHPNDTILEEAEEEESEGVQDDERPSSLDPHLPVTPQAFKSNNQPATAMQKDAYHELNRNEIFALIACFIGPLLGAYLLHAIRSQLTRPAEGLVSNYNLTIFIMAAEIRPVSHIIKLKQDRMTHLQRVVRQDNKDRLRTTDAQEISQRLADVEARMTEPMANSDVDTSKISATVRQGLQPQLDALNRAVRRYEKRQAAQTIQIEARFAELDARLKDALSLAAAAARTGQRPGVVSMLITWTVGMITYSIELGWAATTYPFRFTHALISEIKLWFVKSDREPRRRSKGQSNGAPSISISRMQSRTVR